MGRRGYCTEIIYKSFPHPRGCTLFQTSPLAKTLLTMQYDFKSSDPWDVVFKLYLLRRDARHFRNLSLQNVSALILGLIRCHFEDG